MPPSLTSCNELGSSNEIASRWTERSHYAAHIVASIVVLLMFVPSCFEPQTLEKLESKSDDARVLAPVENVVMYRSDEHVEVRDEPAVFRDAPSVKPEPASLSSVRNVSTPTPVMGKPTDDWQSAPLPPFKPTESTSAHLPPGR